MVDLTKPGNACPKHPTKRRFATVSAAVREADRLTLRLGVPFRSYACLTGNGNVPGCGWYHLTTQPKNGNDVPAPPAPGPSGEDD